MSIIITMPAISPTMTAGKLVCWHFTPGDKVRKGDVIAELETDKANVDIEAPEDGILEEILVEGGTPDVPVETPIGRIGNGVKATVEPEVTPAPTELSVETGHDAPPQRISPLARRLAKEYGIETIGLTGSGPSGRILAADVREAHERAQAERLQPAQSPAAAQNLSAAPWQAETTTILPAGTTLEPHSTMRQTIARRLVEAKQSVPHFYLETRCTVDALLATRKELNAALEEAGNDLRVTINDLIVKAYALAIHRTSEAMVTWSEEGLIRHSSVDIGMAVALDNGLITPIIRDAARLSVGALANASRDAIHRAREGKLTFEEYSGGLAGISNLGMYGVSGFSAIINPPQSMNLAVGTVEKELALQDGQLTEIQVIRFTLSVDHRAIDGVAGARVLQNLKRIIENPVLLTV